MRKVISFFLLLALSAPAFAEDTIRPFPMKTIEALGRDMYQRDQIAWHGFDALFEAHPDAKKRPLRGWITQNEPAGRRLYVIEEQSGRLLMPYIVSFRPGAPPTVEEPKDQELPATVAVRFAARQLAIEAIKKPMVERYNYEVVDDPERKGFLVYAIPAPKAADEIMIGGIYRVSVSADAKAVTHVDGLSRSVVVLEKSASPKDSKVVGSYVSHIVSDTPLESHVYASLSHAVPLYVATNTGVWEVTKGEVKKVEDKKPEKDER